MRALSSKLSSQVLEKDVFEGKLVQQDNKLLSLKEEADQLKWVIMQYGSGISGILAL